MALSHSTVTRNAMADAVDDQVNSGTTDASADFVVVDSSGPTDLLSITLDNPAFGAAASGVITMAGLTKNANAIAGGTADIFDIRNRDNADTITGTITGTGGGGDVEIDDQSIANGRQVNLTSFSWTAPA